MRKILVVSILVLALVLSACGKFEDAPLEVPEMKLTSESINNEGKLLTATAADKGSNNPTGENQSPQLAWEAVEGAAAYAVCMFDEDANWLHWFTTVQETELAQGRDTDHSVYVGPYPPKALGRHNYRIEVFALQEATGKLPGKMDARNTYADIVKGINAKADGQQGNVLARGHIIGTYQNGDNTQ